MTIATTTTPNEHVKGFVTSYAKCWDHFEAYMQDPRKTYRGFIEECKQEAASQGLEDLRLPAEKTFRNRIAKLKQAGIIPERTKSDKPEAVKKRKQREKGTNAQIGQMSTTTTTTSILDQKRGQLNDILATNGQTDPVGTLSGFRHVEYVRPGTDPEYVAAMELACQLYEILERRCTPDERSWGYDEFWHLGGQVRNCLSQLEAQIDYREETVGGFEGDAIDVKPL